MNVKNLLRQFVSESIVNIKSKEPREIEKHLLSRGVDPNKTAVIIDEESGFATFLLYNLSGQLVGYQQYNPKGTKDFPGRGKHASKFSEDQKSLMKYYTYIGRGGDKSTHKIAVWGVETLDERQYLFVTEGIFDAIKVKNAGHPVIAVLANHPKPLRDWFRALAKFVIAIEDNDAAGKKLSTVADASYVVPEPYHDLGDMPQEEVNVFIKKILDEVET
jgi:hypothetical protein